MLRSSLMLARTGQEAAPKKKNSSSLRPLHILHSGSSAFGCRDDIPMKSRFIRWYFHDDMGLSHSQGLPEMPPNYLEMIYAQQSFYTTVRSQWYLILRHCPLVCSSQFSAKCCQAAIASSVKTLDKTTLCASQGRCCSICRW